MYTALVLDTESFNKLSAFFQSVLKLQLADWKIYCHHMTINLGPPEDGPAENLVGQEFQIVATSIAENEFVIAVAVETDVPSNNKTKHITAAVNLKNQGKPKQSNDLTNWRPLYMPIYMKGTVQHVLS